MLFIDGDSCPVIEKAESTAREFGIDMAVFCDTEHRIQLDYGTVHYVGSGRDAADYKLVNMCKKGDVVVTQDYGLAAMAMAKGARCLHYNGMIYNDNNIYRLLTNRYFRTRGKGKKRLKGTPGGYKKHYDFVYALTKSIGLARKDINTGKDDIAENAEPGSLLYNHRVEE